MADASTATEQHIMAVRDLVTTTRPAYGGDWVTALAGLHADPVEAATIATLAAELADAGSFNQAVRVADGQVANGMLRIAAALDARVETIVVSGAETAPSSALAEITLRVLPQPAGHPRPDIDLLCRTLRSFPTADGWAEAATLCSCDGDINAAYLWPADNLAGAVLAQAARWGFRVELLSAAPLTLT